MYNTSRPVAALCCLGLPRYTQGGNEATKQKKANGRPRASTGPSSLDMYALPLRSLSAMLSARAARSRSSAAGVLSPPRGPLTCSFLPTAESTVVVAAARVVRQRSVVVAARHGPDTSEVVRPAGWLPRRSREVGDRGRLDRNRSVRRGPRRPAVVLRVAHQIVRPALAPATQTPKHDARAPSCENK